MFLFTGLTTDVNGYCGSGAFPKSQDTCYADDLWDKDGHIQKGDGSLKIYLTSIRGEVNFPYFLLSPTMTLIFAKLMCNDGKRSNSLQTYETAITLQGGHRKAKINVIVGDIKK